MKNKELFFRHRTIDSRAKFILIKDRRMFSQKYNVLWKKLVNVLFIKQYKNSYRFELSTVPFPPPLNGPIIPYKINSWNNSFQVRHQEPESRIITLSNKVLDLHRYPQLYSRNNLISLTK